MSLYTIQPYNADEPEFENEDRFIVLNPEGYDIAGEHFDINEALTTCEKYNAELFKKLSDDLKFLQEVVICSIDPEIIRGSFDFPFTPDQYRSFAKGYFLEETTYSKEFTEKLFPGIDPILTTESNEFGDSINPRTNEAI